MEILAGILVGISATVLIRACYDARIKKRKQRKPRTYRQLVKATEELLERTKNPHMREKIETVLAGRSVNH
jgi:hypothetical protein